MRHIVALMVSTHNVKKLYISGPKEYMRLRIRKGYPWFDDGKLGFGLDVLYVM
jgi:hypothetical protein